ncbi:protein phosphatase 2C 3-like [Durio zibethinus]|uniref:Protein phosphatase 2C 3-like n=1 Tax=Durio zibethinus TaxID=66656 RepID=A0A6P5ZSW2_DURZI|nr:protein phosphatase 2C 3-like [Durio zibethinus]
MAPSEAEKGRKRQKLQVYAASFSLDCENAEDNSASYEDDEKQTVKVKNGRSKTKGIIVKSHSTPSRLIPVINSELYHKLGVASVCGRRRDMEDAVPIHTSFHRQGQDSAAIYFHNFGLYDGHG